MNLLRSLFVALRSSDLFENWLYAGLKYMLIKYGLAKDSIVVKCNDKKHRLTPDIYSFIINAHYDGYITNFKCNNIIEFIQNNFRFNITDDSKIFLVTPDNIKLYIDSIRLIDWTVLLETWLYDIHFLDFNLNRWFILDIGAYIGDTALYYASKGAFVVAVEPAPKHFELMLKNIGLNPEFKTKILPINVAIANSDGYVDIAVDGDYLDGGVSIYKDGASRIRVKAVTLKSLLNNIKEMGVNIGEFKTKVLKMDCKGCEWDVVNNELDSLKSFDIIKIEYSGYLRNYTVDQLINKLKYINFTCMRYAHNEQAIKIGLDRHGMIHCIRV
ncbi:hypothetical protein GCM10007981_00920 [Thermocladium modestius]|uniref:Methyltransferase FkbM domain-containing protein n=1 Tax=Thermocladium modestius TaxID=62609 RepID=A0A830GQT1_9CREN|nr:FkbM family methyltransferase [Thermocladium modestius]GGP19001.1 hypothetical protein GCM10007981_00920 [Thermocladium modestius]